MLRERPLLVKGEPGAGKTLLAQEIAQAIGAPFVAWHVNSTTRAQQGLYEYDAVSRLRDSQLGDPRVSNIANYIRRGKLWEAFTSPSRPVLLIDEIDKADIEFPNDLLLELDRKTGETIRASLRPIVIITSNKEKELPDAFLRRCFFHYIRFPDAETMRAIVESHFPRIKPRLVEEAMRSFFLLRETPGLKKKPTTSELLDWLKLLLNEDISPETLREREAKKLIPPLHGALLKNEQDVHLFEKLAFLSRRERQSTISRGRVALLGDAAFCVSLMAGQGSALAMAAAYVMAGELGGAGGRHDEAFRTYEALLRSTVASKQKAAERFSAAFAPRTALGLFVRNQVIKACGVPGVAGLAFGRDMTDKFRVPYYDWPHLAFNDIVSA